MNKKHSPFTFLAALSAVAVLTLGTSCCRPSSTGEDIDAYVAVMTERPTRVPTDQWPDAPLTGNGDLGLTLASTPEGVRCYIGKNDFWLAVRSYDICGLKLPGYLDIRGDVFAGDYRAEQLPGTAQLAATYTTDSNALSLRAWVAATDNKVVFELRPAHDMEVTLALDSPNEEQFATKTSGCSGGVQWVTRCYDHAPHLEWPCGVTLALSTDRSSLTLKGGRTTTLVLAVQSNIDSGEQWQQKAIDGARQTDAKAIAHLRKEHRQWWDRFWNLSHVAIGDSLLEYYYYQSQYLMACSSRPGKEAPGLWGPFITTNSTAWRGDYHLNYNYQGPYWGCFSSNQIELTENYDQPILDYMDEGRENARLVLGKQGVYYPVGIGPRGLGSAAWPLDTAITRAWYHFDDPGLENGLMFWKQKSNAAFCAANMLLRFYHTYDAAYARRVYPFVLACADFWEDYLEWDDGRYVIPDDCFNEVHPLAAEDNFNPAMSLGIVRAVFNGALDMSDFLQQDADRREKWEYILAHLSDFPTGVRPDGSVGFKNYERLTRDGNPDDARVTGFSRIHMHGMLIPTGMTGPHLTPDLCAIMLSDLEHRPEPSPNGGEDWAASLGNGIETFYPGAVRIGYPAEKILDYLKDRIRRFHYPNGYIGAYGGGMETLAAVPFTINEMLLQGYEGCIRLFPNWDRSRDASFTTLRTYGAFLVSAALHDGEVQDVHIVSEAGRPCLIENPWPDESVLLRCDGRSEATLAGDILQFDTAPGEAFTLTPLR